MHFSAVIFTMDCPEQMNLTKISSQSKNVLLKEIIPREL
jgi:hypothetical protein